MKQTERQADEAISNTFKVRKEADEDRRTAEIYFRGQPKDFFALPLGDYRIIHALDMNEGLAIVSNTDPLAGPKFYFVSRIPPEKLVTNTVIGIRTTRTVN